jgi:putative hydrolase of the HAD superfamily
MILVFDLDDTLYDERTYVMSGFAAVACMLHARFGWPEASSLAFMKRELAARGRGAIFDRLLTERGALSKALVRACVRTYRDHVPSIRLYPAAERVLRQLDGPLYLVTDGHKVAQQRKVEALDLDRRFRKCFITHRYGIKNAKPSVHCFALIAKLEQCGWSDIVYIGDNPAKDFVNLSPLGVHTVRVLTGQHKTVIAKPGYDARHTIPDLRALPKLLGGL